VVDREGHIYERGAILRWLVLTSTAFDDCGFGGATGDAATAATPTATAVPVGGGLDWSAADVGRGTSPITGRPLAVDELVDDHVVKAAVDRWRQGGHFPEGGRGEAGSTKGGCGARRKKKVEDALGLKDSLKRSHKGGRRSSLMGGTEDAKARQLWRLLDSVSHHKRTHAAVAPAPRASPPSPSGEDQEEQKTMAQSRGPQHCQNDKLFSKRAPPPPPPRMPPATKGPLRYAPRSARDPPAYEASAPPTVNISRRVALPPPPKHDRPPIQNIIPQDDHSCSSLLSDLDLLSVATSTQQPRIQHNGWTVPIGVHKVVCSAPGLQVTSQVHRRSAPLPYVLRPGSYVEVLETRVHGDRVRGRICWEREEAPPAERKEEGKKLSLKTRASRRLRRTARRQQTRSPEEDRKTKMVRYEGWISLQWAEGTEEEGEEHSGSSREGGKAQRASGGVGQGRINTEATATDEDAGPWTEPVPLGVYRINFAGGLPLRVTPDRDSAVLGKLERGDCVEVVQTEVKGDRVRARVIVPSRLQEGRDKCPSLSNAVAKVTSGWISLLKAGSGGASPVPLGAYVVVVEPECTVTEGVRLDSKVKDTLLPGSCLEVVATRMEEGLVRGLLASGGHVTLFAPPRRGGGDGAGRADAGRMCALPVPLGTYQILKDGGVNVTAGVLAASPVLTTLGKHARVEVVETRVDDGRVRGRVGAAAREDQRRMRTGDSAGGSGGGWVNLLEPHERWAKIVRLRDGRPLRRRSMQDKAFGGAVL